MTKRIQLARGVSAIPLAGSDEILTYFREQEKALKAAAAGASKKGPMGGSGIKKSGKK